MYHLKTIVSRSAAIASKQQLAKFAPVNVLPSRNYADHQIPERLKDVATAKGERVFFFKFASFANLSIELCTRFQHTQKMIIISDRKKRRIKIFFFVRLQIHDSLIWLNIFSIVVVKLPKTNWSKT